MFKNFVPVPISLSMCARKAGRNAHSEVKYHLFKFEVVAVPPMRLANE